MHQTILVLDFGSQYTQLIARRLRELSVYSEVLPFNASLDRIRSKHPVGIILSGGPKSVHETGAPRCEPGVLELGVPVLGICYGMQLMTDLLGGRLSQSSLREFGHAQVSVSHGATRLFNGVPESLRVWASHGDCVAEAPPGFTVAATSASVPIAAMEDQARGLYAMLFHPEVVHSDSGLDILRNFAHGVCGCRGDWTIASFIDEATTRIVQQVGAGKVVCALSGGVDSTVAAMLIHRAIGDRLTCIFVDNGLLRLGVAERVVETFTRHLNIKLKHVDATDRFLGELAGVTDPETKRKRIGETFIHLFEDETKALGRVDFLVQGTTYPDVIESASTGNSAAAKIKTHHNVGGLPKDMRLTLIEPMRNLFKDEVRRVGKELGLPDEMVFRQPFPGPGLAIRIIGEVTREKLDILRRADWVLMDEIKKADVYYDMWQSFAVLTDTKSVGVQGDFRTYGHTIALRCVAAEDAMTADWARLPYDLLAAISTRITNEVREVNRIVYDITSKPPGTIEWE